ncbi:MAG: M1 family metallopeptidase [Crocinitomicaceae bacterium]|nr:M1 family metallopeptidase [Crocinitomicaceae bacterium]
MNKLILSIFTILFFAISAWSQNYWQQEVNFKIAVRLDDKNHMLHASEEFEYINNSPNTLTFIYMHLWPNAYKNEKTALGKQLYQTGESLLKYGADSLKGYIDSLDFRSNGQKLAMEYDVKNPDICKVTLAKPLNPGERVTITTPFRVKLPSGEISRMGHIGQSYQITQWFPKPAVYDKNGWNQIPYLTQGEFYSEYGSFDVSITLPKNYVVGATGDLQTASELQFLNELAVKTKVGLEGREYGKGKIKTPFPASDSEFKTIRYKQDRVHDFAWFADKRYEVLKGEIELPHSKRKVTSWTMFVPENAKLWSKSIEYINDATYYYSKWNGDYPYNQVTAVDGTISAGGGMEYPTITVIGNASSASELEIVIVHEVGHNWFYGILGSNERVHGWMDEGLNTLNEMRYIQTKYPDNTNFSDMLLNGKLHMNDLNHHDMGDISYRVLAMLGEDQPIETHSADFTGTNYGIIMYQKTGMVFLYLKDYLGEEKFDQAMKVYFETYKFKHPQPEDLRRVLEENTGKNLSWLFDDLIQTTNHMDYKIKSVKQSKQGKVVTVKNVGQVNGPIGVSVVRNDSIVEQKWIEPGKKKSTVLIGSSDFDLVQIDGTGMIPEIDKSNNNWFSDKLFHKIEPITFEFLLGDHERKKSNNFWLPVVAGNAHDKLMVGIAIHNYGIPLKRFQYLLAPMYSTGRNSLSGIGEFSYTFLPKSTFKMVRLGTSLKSFKNDNTFKDNESYYAAAMPYVFLKIGNRKNSSPFSNQVLIQTIYRNDQLGSQTTDQAGAYLNYQFSYLRQDHQLTSNVRFELMDNLRNSNEMSRTSLDVTYRFRYLKNKKKSWVELRAYIGGFTSYTMNTLNDNRYDLSLAGSNGFQDIFLEDYFFDRTRTASLSSNTQRLSNQGGFRTTSNFGSSQEWISSANFYIESPIKIFGVYADLGSFSKDKVVYGVAAAGIGIRLGKVVGVYFPVWMSKNLNDAYAGGKYGEKIRLSLKLNLVNTGFKLSSLF